MMTKKEKNRSPCTDDRRKKADHKGALAGVRY